MRQFKRCYASERWLMRGLSRSTSVQGQGVGELLLLGTLGVTFSLLMMLVAVSISLGFNRQVSTLAYSQTGHISLYPRGENWLNTSETFRLTERLRSLVEQQPYVADIYPWIQQRAMLKTRDDYTGVLLLGADSEMRHPYFSSRILEGQYPSFSNSDTILNPIVLPSRLAERVGCSVGDKVQMYFLHQEVHVRSFRIMGIYDASGLEQLPVLCYSKVLRGVEKLPSNVYHRLAIELHSSSEIEQALKTLISLLETNINVLDGQALQIVKAREMMPELFGWLDLLDSNVYILLGLMLVVSGFTMISGLLIVVLDKTQQIGILKALGANVIQIRRIFVILSVRLTLRAMLWANSFFVLIYFMQNRFHVLRLTPENYYVDFVPMHIELWQWLAINFLTLIVVLLSLLLPSQISSKISPVEAIKFE